VRSRAGEGGDVAAGRSGAGSAGGSRRRILPILILVLAGATAFATGVHRYLTLESIVIHRQMLQEFVAAHRSSALLLYMLVYVGAVTLSIPGAAFLTITGGFLFGWLIGGAAAAVSGTIGATFVFLIARTSLGDVLIRRAGAGVRRLAAGFREDAFSYLLFLRFLPIVPFWLTNLASALFGVPLRTFLLATQIGVIPGTYAFAVAGSGLDSVIEAQHGAQRACLEAGGVDCGFELKLRYLITPPIVAAFLALGLLSLVPVIVKRFYWGRLTGPGGDG
jgi:uncharacterized membrane protein YdjX (TVP38/TMEM64 family)